MTFEEKCKKFQNKTEQESNIFKRIYRTIFLNKKMQVYEKEKNMFKLDNFVYLKSSKKEH